MMYKTKQWAGIACILLLSYACSSKPIEIEGFNGYVWQQDKWGCGNEREKMLVPLMNNKEQLLGMREPKLFRLLGKPDEMELYTRNQKFLIYYLEPNLHCTAALPAETEKTNASALHIRLNAMGMAQEMFIKNR